MARRELSQELLNEIQREVDGAPHGAKTATLEPWADLLGCSVATLYRHLGRKRKRRKVGCGRRPSIPEHLLEFIWDTKIAAEEIGLANRRLSTRRALANARALELDGADDASVSGINAAIRRLGWDLEPVRQRMEPLHALDVVHLDFSRSKYFQIYAFDGSDYLLRVDGRQLQYKEEGRAMRSWIVGIIDGHSRLSRLRMYPATGEDATLALQALQQFWTAETEHPFVHAPRVLWSDRGAAARTKAFTDVMASLDINVHLAQSKEAQGKIERQFRTLWSDFEVPLALELGHGAHLPLAEYNARLEAWCIEQCGWHHPTQRGTRGELYQKSIRLTLPDGRPVARTLDADLLGALFFTDYRVVDDTRSITIDRQSYRVPEKIGRIYVDRGMRLRVSRYQDGTVVASLVDAPHEEPVVLQTRRLGHSHPVARPATGAEIAGERIDIRQPHGRGLDSRPEAPSRATGTVRRPLTAVNLSGDPEQLTPDGPREEANTSRETILTGPELRTYVGRRLAPYRLTYADVADGFDDLDGAAQAAVDARLTAFLNVIATRTA